MTEVENPYKKYYPECPNSKTIRRIALKDSAVVEMLRVESPSSLFVRPVDHIRDQLVYQEPHKMTPITEFDEGNYALAPIEERTFGRCIIVKNIERLEACRVFFIDEAVTANVSWKCLFQIDDIEMFHPWQAMHITLGRLVSLTNEWSFEQCRDFYELLTEFPTFQITPCQIDLEDQSDRPSILVNLCGILKDKPIEQSVAIEEICNVIMKDVLVTVFPINLTDDPKLSDLDSDQDDLEVILLEEFRRNLPSDWIHEAADEYVEGDEAWDIEKCKVNEWNDTWLQKYLLEDETFWGFVHPNAILSPWEMYVTPIVVKKDEVMNDEQWIIDQFDVLKKKQRFFDDFYSNVKNQRPLEEDEIRIALSSGRAYAIAAVQHRKKTGAQWLRIELLDFLPNNNMAVRFVDQGYKGFAKLKNIFSIHRTHTIIPPFVIEMGRFFEDDTLTEAEMGWSTFHWKQIVPSDVPLVFGPRLEFVETGKLLFSEIQELEEEGNLLDEIPPAPVFTEQSEDSWSSSESESEIEEEYVEYRDRYEFDEEEDDDLDDNNVDYDDVY